ncbi:MAG: nucleotide pyrophosphohydrolase [Nanoarchaeota archaeon]|nr:nucleotide pyrophosphohydrolase [Nanoarchaeota archaeon]
MPFNKIQKDVDDWVQQYKIEYFHPLAIITQLSEEVGELAREVNNRHGPRIKKSPEDTADMGKEIADSIFALTCLANSQKIDLNKSWKSLIDKLYKRDKNRFEKKEN